MTYDELIAIKIERDATGVSHCVLPFSPAIEGRPGFLHGGVIAGALERAATLLAGEAVAQMPDRSVRMISISVQYLRPAICDRLYAQATVIRRGSRILNLQSECWQHDRQLPAACAAVAFSVEG